MFQYRRDTPRAGGRDPFYTPERDLAVIGPSLIRAAVVALEEKFWEPWFVKYMAEQGLGYLDLVDGALKLAKGTNRIIALKDPAVAMEESGFAALPPAIQTAFYTKLGQVLLAAVWAGTKDCSKPEDSPPVAIGELFDEIAEQFNKFHHVQPAPDAG
jgi:hypothetical protein